MKYSFIDITKYLMYGNMHKEAKIYITNHISIIFIEFVN